jgi:hypothetical protein
MAHDQYMAAEQAARKLAEKDERELLEELGKRIEDEKQPGGQQRKMQFDADFVDTSELAGWGTLQEIGRLWFHKAESELMKFVCDKQNADRERLTAGKTIPQLAAFLATNVVITVFTAPPAWLIVAGTIVAQKLAATGIEALCEVYYEHRGKA